MLDIDSLRLTDEEEYLIRVQIREGTSLSKMWLEEDYDAAMVIEASKSQLAKALWGVRDYFKEMGFVVDQLDKNLENAGIAKYKEGT